MDEAITSGKESEKLPLPSGFRKVGNTISIDIPDGLSTPQENIRTAIQNRDGKTEAKKREWLEWAPAEQIISLAELGYQLDSSKINWLTSSADDIIKTLTPLTEQGLKEYISKKIEARNNFKQRVGSLDEWVDNIITITSTLEKSGYQIKQSINLFEDSADEIIRGLGQDPSARRTRQSSEEKIRTEIRSFTNSTQANGLIIKVGSHTISVVKHTNGEFYTYDSAPGDIYAVHSAELLTKHLLEKIRGKGIADIQFTHISSPVTLTQRHVHNVVPGSTILKAINTTSTTISDQKSSEKISNETKTQIFVDLHNLVNSPEHEATLHVPPPSGPVTSNQPQPTRRSEEGEEHNETISHANDIKELFINIDEIDIQKNNDDELKKVYETLAEHITILYADHFSAEKNNVLPDYQRKFFMLASELFAAATTYECKSVERRRSACQLLFCVANYCKLTIDEQISEESRKNFYHNLREDAQRIAKSIAQEERLGQAFNLFRIQVTTSALAKGIKNAIQRTENTVAARGTKKPKS
ncbi:MAG: hypothetical protein KIT56_00490 [Gammaproteobacteria bacterium]|nr:hypothetical protein [Gammaproteobacteria bacterium]MCW5582364.1 hypothetical protein [Gammaproteobacteria bacterium]